MVQHSSKHSADPTYGLRKAPWISAVLIVIAATVSFFIKDAVFARHLACAGVFSIALWAVYVVVEKRILGTARRMEAEGKVEDAGRYMVIHSIIASVVRGVGLAIGLILMLILFKFQPIPVAIGLAVNYLGVFIANTLFRSPYHNDQSISQQDKES